MLFVGDNYAMAESRKAIKAEFIKNRDAPSSGSHFEGLLGMVDEAVDMMKTGIMQGELNRKTGNYGTFYFCCLGGIDSIFLHRCTLFTKRTRLILFSGFVLSCESEA